jgi:hypothetical protein
MAVEEALGAITLSTTLSQVPQTEHLPIHFGNEAPQDVHSYLILGLLINQHTFVCAQLFLLKFGQTHVSAPMVFPNDFMCWKFLALIKIETTIYCRKPQEHSGSRPWKNYRTKRRFKIKRPRS